MPEREKVAGIEEMRKNRMMEHLMRSLRDNKDIGHLGRLTFVMVARHFIDEPLMVRFLIQNPGISAVDAMSLILQVKRKGYNPPTGAKIREWQSQQEFQIIPDGDPDENPYSNLTFPDEIYKNIQEYYVEQAKAELGQGTSQEDSDSGNPETGLPF